MNTLKADLIGAVPVSATEDAKAGIHPETETPTEPGWYECWAIDDRWGGEMQYRAFGSGLWWTPLKDGWVSGRHGVYRWRGPVADVNGPAPDGTNPTTTNARATGA